MNKTRYKTEISGQTYTIVGKESKAHMDAVIHLVNQQLAYIKGKMPEASTEQAAILLAVNVLSEELHHQEQLNELQEEWANLTVDYQELEELRVENAKLQEIETRLKRFENFEKRAKEMLAENGTNFNELSIAEIQDAINKQVLAEIKKESETDVC